MPKNHWTTLPLYKNVIILFIYLYVTYWTSVYLYKCVMYGQKKNRLCSHTHWNISHSNRRKFLVEHMLQRDDSYKMNLLLHLSWCIILRLDRFRLYYVYFWMHFVQKFRREKRFNKLKEIISLLKGVYSRLASEIWNKGTFDLDSLQLD